MSAEFDSDLRRRLQGLSSEVGPAGLPGPAAARRRARQRARNQAVGAVLGAAVIVGGAVVAVAQPTLLTAPEPAGPGDIATSSPAPTSSMSPTPTDATPDTATLPTSVLLQLSDIEPEGEPIGWMESDRTVDPWPCAPVAPASDRVLQRLFVNPEAGRIEHIVEATDAGQVQSRFDEIYDDLVSCVESGAASGADFRLDEIWTVTGVGDQAVLVRYWAPLHENPPGQGQLIVSVSIARSGDAVTTVTRGGFAQDANVPDTSDDAQAAIARLCPVTGGACVTDPDQRRTYPEPAADLPGWLTVADVAEAAGEDRITAVSEVLVGAPGNFGFVCFQSDATSAGATSVESRTFHDALDPAAVGVEEVIAWFPSDAAARDHYTALTAEGDACNAEPSLDVQNTGTVEGGGMARTTWRATVAETDSVFVYGIVVNGSAVAYVRLDLPSAADDDLGRVLTLAGEHLADPGAGAQ